MLWMLEKENPELGEDVVAPTVDEGVLVPKPPRLPQVLDFLSQASKALYHLHLLQVLLTKYSLLINRKQKKLMKVMMTVLIMIPISSLLFHYLN
jgi:hypothetical protein